MKSKSKNKGKLILAIIIILLLAIIGGGVGVAYAYSNGGESFAKAYIRYDGNVYNAPGGELVKLPYQGVARFEIDGAGFGKKPKNFTLRILPNPNCDFYFEYDGKFAKFSNASELTAAFDIEYGDGYFEIIGAAKQYTPDKVLAELLGGDVKVNGELSDTYYYIFEVTIEGETVIELFVRQPLTIAVEDVQIPPEIDFFK